MLIKEMIEEYYVSSSPDSPIDGEWNEIAPKIGFAGFLFRRTVFSFADNTYSSSKPCMLGTSKELWNCRDCKWYAEFEGVCCNGDSEHRADFMGEDDCCEEWELERI